MPRKKFVFPVIRGPVDPKVARRGTFIISFPLGELELMKIYADQLKQAAARNEVHGEFVYTRIAMWSKGSENDTWQIFLMPEGWDRG